MPVYSINNPVVSFSIPMNKKTDMLSTALHEWEQPGAKWCKVTIPESSASQVYDENGNQQ